MSNSIKVVGVGGQGAILAAKIICSALVNKGYDVKMSEIHGMSQRGGTVSADIKYGKEVFSPVIEKGSADILVSFELMETGRNLDYLKKDGIALINNHKINSMVTLNAKVPYPENIIESVSKKVKTYKVEAQSLAIELGNAKVVNLIMLGAAIKALNLVDLNWKEAISENVKPQFLDINLKAFDLGLKQVN